MTKVGHGIFKRHLRKMNHADWQMRIAHKGMFADRFLDRKRFRKWKSVYNKWAKKAIPKH